MKKLLSIILCLMLCASYTAVFAETLPLTDNTQELTYFVGFGGNDLITGYSESELYKELEKRTNVHIEFETPSGETNQAFLLRITSDELPDIIEGFCGSYPGGLESMVSDGVAIDLTDLINQYAPNYKRLLEQHPDWAKDVTTDDGKYYAFYMCRYDRETESKLENPWAGLHIRKDWLQECGLEIPTTIDELTTVLRTFKEKMGASTPMTWYPTWMADAHYDFILGAWNISSSFYQKDGKVNYGPLTPEYKEYITTLKSWYDEGLLDKEYLTRDETGIDVLIAQDQVGVYTSTEVAEIRSISEAIPFPSLVKGETHTLGMDETAVSGGSYAAVITTSCKNPELAVKWLDYAYGPEGALLFNYGIEGVTYTLDNSGNPVYTDFVLKDGLEDDKWWAYCNGVYSRINGPMLKWFDAIPSYSMPDNSATIDGPVWAQGIDYTPQLFGVTLNQDENSQVATIMADINTYVSEMTDRFIMGLEPMDNYDAFVERIRSLGIEDAISIEQTALDRYNAR